MATANIDAGLVLDFCVKKHAEIVLDQRNWRAEQIAKVQAEPKITGRFWRRVITHLNAEQAEAEYDRLVKFKYTKQWWDAYGRGSGSLIFINRVQQLARVSIESGDGFVTLDDKESRLLGLGVAA